MDWTKRETLKFIELWQGYPCLWDTKNSDYKNRSKRREALEKISRYFDVDYSAIEKKILSLKTQFNRENNKLKSKFDVGLECDTESSWYAYKHLKFLNDVRPTTESFTINVDEEDVILNSKVDHSTVNPEVILTQQYETKRKRKLDNHVGTLSLLRSASNAIINRQKKDEFSIFGEHIGNELRDIESKEDLLKLKKDIMDLIYNTKLRIVENKKIDDPSKLQSPVAVTDCNL